MIGRVRRDGPGRGEGRTVEEADVDAGVANVGGQRLPDIEVGARGILQVSRGMVSVCFDQWTG